MSAAYAKLTDTKASGTAGGTATAGAWYTRDLNTEDTDVTGIVTLASNQFTLQAGTYYMHAESAFYVGTSNCKIRIRNITDGTTALLSMNQTAVAYGNIYAVADGVVVIAAQKTFEVQYRVGATIATAGLGTADNMSGISEYYTRVVIEKNSSTAQYACVLADTTVAAAISSGAWRTAPLNTEVADPGNIGSLSSDQITLGAGTYEVLGFVTCYSAVLQIQARWQNITDGTTAILGRNVYAWVWFDGYMGPALLAGRFTIAGTKVFELQARVNTGGYYGGPMSFGVDERYPQVTIRKVA